MQEADITHWKYKFMWRNVSCEARDGRIFINNRCVEELPDVNHSSQVGDRFFIGGRDVTDICAKYLPSPETKREDKETESLKERIVTAAGESLATESLATESRAPLSGVIGTDSDTQKKSQSEKGIFGFGTKKGRSSMRQGKTA